MTSILTDFAAAFGSHPVNQCDAGDALLLKEDALEGNRGLGAVHRSPPMAERSLRRLFFKVDEVVA